MIGKTLGHYQITGRMGKGGMGEVFRAGDQKLGREVAIKILPAEFAREADRVARFEREAKLLASLNHPNIAAIHGLEESGGTNFLVLELVEGETLADRIKTGPIPVEESLKLALQITEALEAAHDKGIIHRDLKPANIKVTPEGKVKVLDFGLAKAYQGEREDVNLSNSPTLSDAATQMGVILGTAAYMSPEQARGKPVDKRADVWAFGCVLFEMLAGRAAFSGKDVTDILAAVIKSEPDWKSLPANLHWRLREVIERCLEKEARNRYSGISDARVDIQKVLTDPSGVFAQPSIGRALKKKAVLPWVALAVVLLAIAAAAIWYLKPAAPPPEVTRFYYELPEGLQFINNLGQYLAVSHDGKKFVCSTTEGLLSRSIGEMDAKLIAGTAGENVLYPTFSPDGKWMAYLSQADSKFKKIAVGGGAPVVLCDIKGSITGIAWDEADTLVISKIDIIAAGMLGEIMKVSANGGTPESIVKIKGEAAMNPQMLPGGKAVLFTKWEVLKNPASGARITVQSLESGKSRELFAGYAARYLPTGHLVYTLGNSTLETGGHNLFAVPFDADKLETKGGAVSLVEDIRGPLGEHYEVSDSGTLVYLPGSKGALGGQTPVWVNREGKEESISVPPNQYAYPKVSPDGSRAAFTIANNLTEADIWVWDFVRKSLTRLTFNKASITPVWTPDSKRIVYRSAAVVDQRAVYWKAADGAGKEEKLYSAPGRDVIPWSFSSDGKSLLVSDIEGLATMQNNKFDIAILPMEGERKLKPLLNESYVEVQPQVSPDGRWIAYSSQESTGEALKTEVYVRPFPEVDKGKWQASTGGGGCPRWSPDGKELYYLSNDNELMAVAVQRNPSFNLGTPQRLFKSSYAGLTGSSGISWDVGRDGRFLMMKEPGSPSQSDAAGPRKINVVLNWTEELKQRVPVK